MNSVYGAIEMNVSVAISLANDDDGSSGVYEISENPLSGGNGDASSEPITCNVDLYSSTDEKCAHTVGPGSYSISCSNSATVSFLPVLGMERSIKKILQEPTISSVSFYGFGTEESDASKSVGLLCTVSAKFDPDTGTPQKTVIDGSCRLSVNGYEAAKGTHYTIRTPGITTASFPSRPT